MMNRDELNPEIWINGDRSLFTLSTSSLSWSKSPLPALVRLFRSSYPLLGESPILTASFYPCTAPPRITQSRCISSVSNRVCG